VDGQAAIGPVTQDLVQNDLVELTPRALPNTGGVQLPQDLGDRLRITNHSKIIVTMRASSGSIGELDRNRRIPDRVTLANIVPAGGVPDAVRCGGLANVADPNADAAAVISYGAGFQGRAKSVSPPRFQECEPPSLAGCARLRSARGLGVGRSGDASSGRSPQVVDRARLHFVPCKP